MKVILNKTKNSSERHTLISGSEAQESQQQAQIINLK